MASGSLSKVIQRLRHAALCSDDSLTDGQLLECFCNQQEEAAFEGLMRRHGSMVMGVCQRILQNSHDAEDAFQATFLVLVRKAGALMGRKTVGNWLFGVAYHTALKARAATVKRRFKEQQVKAAAQEPDDGKWQELQHLLDQELARLPDDYREAVVLCDLEGKTRKEAARKLGWPEGTLSGRIARARVLLSQRLARRGVVVSGGLLAMILSAKSASASVPAPLLVSTIKAAACVAADQALTAGIVSAKVAALTQGALKAMLISKLKIATFVLLGLSLFTFGALALNSGTAQENQGKSKKAKIVEIDLGKLPPDLAKQLADFAKGKTAKKSGQYEDKQDGKKKTKTVESQSGFQGEQQGQHEDKDEVPKKGKGKGEQQGQNEDKEDGNKKAKKGKASPSQQEGQNEDKNDGKKKKSKQNDQEVSLLDDFLSLPVVAQEKKKDDGQQNQKDDGQKNQKDDGQQNQKDEPKKESAGLRLPGHPATPVVAVMARR